MIAHNLAFQHVMRLYAEEIIRVHEAGPERTQHHEAAELAAYDAVCSVVDASEARAIATYRN